MAGALCSTSVLTGADGLLEFAPAGTTLCLGDNSAFPAGTSVIVPASNGFIAGDPIAFVVQGNAVLDTAMGVGGQVYTTTVLGVSQTNTEITVEDVANPGSALTFNGDGGTGTADTPGAANHINVIFGATEAVCSVSEWSLSLEKSTTDVTTLPCSVGTGGAKVAPVRKSQGTFLEGTGSMSIMFTGDQTSMGQRLLGNSVMTDSKVYAKMYVNAVSAGASIDDAASSYFEGSLNLLGFSISVNTTDAIIAEVSFALAEAPKAIFGVKF